MACGTAREKQPPALKPPMATLERSNGRESSARMALMISVSSFAAWGKGALGAFE